MVPRAATRQVRFARQPSRLRGVCNPRQQGERLRSEKRSRPLLPRRKTQTIMSNLIASPVLPQSVWSTSFSTERSKPFPAAMPGHEKQ